MGLPGPYLYPTVAKRFFEENQLAPKTVKSYGRTFRMLQNLNPGKRIEQFTLADLVEFFTVDHTTGGPSRWEATTVLTKRNPLVTLFTWAADDEVGLRPDGAELALKLKKKVGNTKATPRRKHTWLTPPDVRAILDGCDDSAVGVRDRILFMFYLGTGVRLFEGVGSTWDKVDLRQGTLLVHGKGAGGGGKTRTVQLIPQLVDALGDWRDRYAAAIGAVPGIGVPVLVPAKGAFEAAERGARGRLLKVVANHELHWGRRIGESTVAAVVRSRAAAAGIAGCGPHDLRRSYAGILQNEGLPIEDISYNLGHANISTTQRYLSDNPARRAAKIAKVVAW